MGTLREILRMVSESWAGCRKVHPEEKPPRGGAQLAMTFPLNLEIQVHIL